MSWFTDPGPGKINITLSLAMVGIFSGLGLLFVATNVWIEDYPRPTRTYIGGVLLGWALFRGISVWMRWRRMKNEEDDDY